MRPSPYVILPVGLMVLGLLAAPLYGNVMESMMWAGETFKAMCGF
jgi:hypothetical protein